MILLGTLRAGSPHSFELRDRLTSKGREAVAEEVRRMKVLTRLAAVRLAHKVR